MRLHRAILKFLLALSVVLPVWATGCGGPSSEPEAPKSEPSSQPAKDDDAPSFRRARTPDIDNDDDDDGLEVEGLRGRLDTYDIQEGMRPHAGKLQRCYTDYAGRRRYVGGDIELGFVVERDGTVKSVHVTQSDLGAWPVEKCMLEVCRQMRFPKPKGNAAAEFSVPLSFAARSRVDDWNEARTESEVSEISAEIDSCAEETGAGAPTGVLVTLYVGSRGKVKSVGFAAGEGAIDPSWADCAAAKILAWTLTDPRGRVARARFVYK